MSVRLESDVLSVRISPRVGGTITEVRHKATGLSVLGRVPWEAVDAPLPGPARNEPEWLTRYSGGWPLLFPNAGDACTVDGVFHGFHGEASISPWEVVESLGQRLVLERHFDVITASMRRTISVMDETLSVREELTYHGEAEVHVMWGHHPTFGSDLLDGPVEITSGASEVAIEPSYAPPDGTDMFNPSVPLAALAYLSGFDSGWANIRRRDDAIAARLSWDAPLFPCAWLWIELEGTTAEPWAGRTRLIGLEPNTTPCAHGLAEARRRGLPLLDLRAGQRVTSTVSLRVYEPLTARPS